MLRRICSNGGAGLLNQIDRVEEKIKNEIAGLRFEEMKIAAKIEALSEILSSIEKMK